MKKFFYLLILLCSTGHYAFACDVANPSTSSLAPDCVGQSGFFGQAFTACESGEWTTLSFSITGLTGSGTATVYTAEGDIANSALASAQSEGTFTTSGVHTININRPVIDASRYIWWVVLDAGISEMCYEVSTNNFGVADDYVHSETTSGLSSNSGALRSTGAATSRMGGAVAFIAQIIAAPIAATNAATAVNTVSATLNGMVDDDDNGNVTSIMFEYGTSTAYGSTITATPSTLNNGSGSQAVSANLAGLLPSTTYHFRVTATNATGTTNGVDMTFTTAAAVVAVEPIPTLSQWGLLIIALLVLNLGLIFIRKKESVLL